MREISFDYENVELKNGEYLLRVVSVEESISSSGNDMLVWKFKVVDTGHQIKHWTAMTPAAMWKLVEALAALGAKVGEGKNSINLDDLEGRFCRGQIMGNDAGYHDIEKLLPTKKCDAKVIKGIKKREATTPDDGEGLPF